MLQDASLRTARLVSLSRATCKCFLSACSFQIEPSGAASDCQTILKTPSAPSTTLNIAGQCCSMLDRIEDGANENCLSTRRESSAVLLPTFLRFLQGCDSWYGTLGRKIIHQFSQLCLARCSTLLTPSEYVLRLPAKERCDALYRAEKDYFFNNPL